MSRPENAMIPDANQVAERLEACSPRPRRRGTTLAVLLSLLLGMIIAVAMLPVDLALVVPWLAILGFVGWLAWKKHRVSRAQRGVEAAGELTLLRRPIEALEAIWTTLPRVQPWPELHVRAVMLLGENLRRLGATEPALATQDYLLAHVPKQHPSGVMTRLARTLTLLREDRLTDADDELRSLRRASLPPRGRAMWRVGQLYRQLKTNNLAEAREELAGGSLIRELGPLGVEAGLGYAMAATVYDALGESAAADAWWRRATMMIEPEALLEDLPEAAGLRERAPARSLAAAMREDGLV